jgi:hypothetical protein
MRFVPLTLVLFRLRLSPRGKEHYSSEEQHYQSPPEIDIDKEGALVSSSIGEESKQGQQDTEDNEQRAEWKTKVDIHKTGEELLTKDQVKNQGQQEDSDPDRNRAQEPATACFRGFVGQRINQTFELFFATRFGKKADHDRNNEADGPGIDSSPKILRHLAWVGVNQGDPGALDPRGGARRDRQTVVDRRGHRSGEQAEERAMPGRAFPKHPQQKGGKKRRVDKGKDELEDVHNVVERRHKIGNGHRKRYPKEGRQLADHKQVGVGGVSPDVRLENVVGPDRVESSDIARHP